MTCTYILNTSSLNDDSRFNAFYDKMSDYRREKIDSKCHRRDKNLSLGVGILIDDYLSKTGLCERRMEYTVGKNGKPYFKDRQDIFFNASHSGEMAVCVFSDNEVGCDIEIVKGASLRVAERFFAESEYSFIVSTENYEERQKRFFRLWTLKESYLKCIGRGLPMGLSSFEVVFESNRPVVYTGRKREEVCFKEYDCDGYFLSVCSKSDSFSNHLVRIEL